MSVYLDYNATTPVDPRVADALLPFLRERFGNPASPHARGRAAQQSVEAARERVAALLGVRPASVFWTSGATESLNTLLKGLASYRLGPRCELVVGATEHKAVLDTVAFLEQRGVMKVIRVPAYESGELQVPILQELVTENTLAVCVMAANNETGIINDIARIADIVHSRGALLICDATQAAGKIPIDLEACDVDYAAVSAHKLYGSQGIGALVACRAGSAGRIEPLLHGGGHQDGLRSGTLNVPGIVSFGVAADIAMSEMSEEASRLAELRDRLERLIEEQASPVTIHSQKAPRLPNTTNVRLHGVDAEALIANCPDVAFSSGSACTSSTPTPSHVLTAMGVPPTEAEESIRLSLGRFTTQAEVDRAAELIGQAAGRIRELNR